MDGFNADRFWFFFFLCFSLFFFFYLIKMNLFQTKINFLGLILISGLLVPFALFFMEENLALILFVLLVSVLIFQVYDLFLESMHSQIVSIVFKFKYLYFYLYLNMYLSFLLSLKAPLCFTFEYIWYNRLFSYLNFLRQSAVSSSFFFNYFLSRFLHLLFFFQAFKTLKKISFFSSAYKSSCLFMPVKCRLALLLLF